MLLILLEPQIEHCHKKIKSLQVGIYKNILFLNFYFHFLLFQLKISSCLNLSLFFSFSFFLNFYAIPRVFFAASISGPDNPNSFACANNSVN
jgi:hypothetical protein